MLDECPVQLAPLFEVASSGDQPWTPCGPIAWSTTNILALTSTTPYRHFLHFVHPETPWECTTNATAHMADITALQFDGKGTMLCVIDRKSVISIWMMKDGIVNDWQPIQASEAPENFSYKIDTQPIIASSWSNVRLNYNRINWTVRPEDVTALWTKKFSKSGPSSLLKSRNLDTCVITVSTRGLLSFVTPLKPARSTYLPITSVQCADVVVPECDTVDVALVDSQATLRLYTVATGELGNVSSSIKLLRVVDLGGSPGAGRMRVLDLKFDRFLSSDSDFFVVIAEAAAGEGGGGETRVEKWRLIQRPVTLNAALVSTGELGSKLQWERQHSTPLPASLSSATLSVPLLSYGGDTPCPVGRVVLVSSPSAGTSLLDRTSLRLLETRPSDTHVTFSPAACCLGSLTPSALSLLAFRSPETEAESETIWLSCVLEHCVLNNWDYWELLAVACRREEALSSLEHTFNRSFDSQAREIRQLYFSRIMAIKTSLYKLQPTFAHWPKQIWCSQFLGCLTEKLKSLLPAEVATNLTTPADVDLNNWVNIVDTRQYGVSEQVLIAHQPFFQWTLDYAQLIALCVMPHARTHSSYRTLVTDSRSLHNLRDLLGLIRIWSHLAPRCAPVVAGGTPEQDISGIFRAVSQLVKQFPSKSEVQDSEFDKVVLYQQELTVMPTVVTSSLGDVMASTSPVSYTMLTEPNTLKCAKILADRPVVPVARANSVINSTDRDVLRNAVLPAHALHVRHDHVKVCAVCGAATSLGPPTNHVQWWSRWKQTCVCGGSWRRPAVLA